MTKHLQTFLKSIMAGLMIALGATAYLSVPNHYIGMFLFTIGLYTIYTLEFNLYTGKIGYFLEDKDLIKIILIWLGNLIGTYITAKLMVATRLVSTSEFLIAAKSCADTKLSDGYLSIFILGIFCGLLMFIAAECFKRTQNTPNSIGGYVGLFLCVMLFLSLGFEHSIANMFYFTVADVWSFNTLIALIIVSLGNAVGGLLINVVNIMGKMK